MNDMLKTAKLLYKPIKAGLLRLAGVMWNVLPVDCLLSVDRHNMCSRFASLMRTTYPHTVARASRGYCCVSDVH